MNNDQILILSILVLVLGLFAWGRLRHDLVAMSALVLCNLTGLVPLNAMFTGFAHPAVITVACVLIVSHALENAGVVDLVSRNLDRFTTHKILHIGIMTFTVTIASAFMNNVGALAIMLPVAIATAKKQNRSPALILMPLAFGSILGGMTTMIGTPPNIIIASFRADLPGKEAFGMFDFSPAGVPVAIAGFIFVILVGWRLLPKERLKHNAADELYEVGKYLAELQINKDSDLIGNNIRSVILDDEWDLRLVGIGRENKPSIPLHSSYIFNENDILLVHGKAEDMAPLIEKHQLSMLNASGIAFDDVAPEDLKLFEGIIPPESSLVSQGVPFLRRKSLGSLALFGLSRHGKNFKRRLRRVRFKVGDILLLQGKTEAVDENINRFRLLPLAPRKISLTTARQAGIAIGIFALAIISGILKITPLYVSFILAIMAYVMLGIMPARKLYDNIDWPIIVLLGAMIPVGQALDTTGTTALLAGNIVAATTSWDIVWVITLVLVTTMFLSDIINNAATVLVMAPIAVNISQQLSVSTDPFLMAVAIGASCAFLTPIGHQSNTLVMGPGGYKFSDYWRMGLPLEVIIVIVAVPLILWTWPL